MTATRLTAIADELERRVQSRHLVIESPKPREETPREAAEPGQPDYARSLAFVRQAGQGLQVAEQRHRELIERYRVMLEAATAKLKASQDMVRAAEDRALRAEARQRDADERAARAEARQGEAEARAAKAEDDARSDRRGLALIREAFERFQAAHLSLRSEGDALD
jgi:hypothetical protein